MILLWTLEVIITGKSMNLFETGFFVKKLYSGNSMLLKKYFVGFCAFVF